MHRPRTLLGVLGVGDSASRAVSGREDKWTSGNQDLVLGPSAAAGHVPVSAKIRAGFDHARAVEAGGASLLTVHCRTRRDGYCIEVDWTRIARAAAAVDIPVCGNGGVNSHADLERMREETGCALVMVGQAALADPWIFSGHAASRAQAADFMLRYDRVMADSVGDGRGPVRRLKQLFAYWTAGNLIRDEEGCLEWLRIVDPLEMLARLGAIAGEDELSSSSAP